MSIGSYLETLPFSGIAKYTEGPPKNAFPFTGYPRQHPSDKGKLILVYDPLGLNPTVLEFRIEDVLHVEDVHSAVTQNGEGVPLVKLWVRKGAHGVILEPFEVEDPVRFANKQEELRNRFLKFHTSRSGADSSAKTAARTPGV
jgi:inorganic pyrophosphatase